MKDLQQKARRSLNGEPTHVIYETKFGINLVIYGTWNLTKNEQSIQKKKYRTLTNVNSFSDEVLKKSNTDKYIKQIDDITDEEGSKKLL